MAWLARGKCKVMGRKKNSIPTVVLSAAPALAKAGSADFEFLIFAFLDYFGPSYL